MLTQMPKKSSWISAEEAVKDAIALEKELNVKLHTIHRNAEKICDDPHVSDISCGNFNFVLIYFSFLFFF